MQQPRRDVVALWNDYMDLVSTRDVREHLGLSMSEWLEMPAQFTDWAPRLYRLDRERGGASG